MSTAAGGTLDLAGVAQGTVAGSTRSARDGAAALGCFHCGAALPAQPYPVLVEGVEQATCCRGCQAVAQTIVEAGLCAYYRTRSSLPTTPQAADDVLQRLGLYDVPDVQRSFVVSGDDPADKEAALLLSGIACPACCWLIERSLAALSGVRAVQVNYATCRARIRWDDRALHLSAILAAIEALGYRAAPYDSTRADDPLQKERRSLLWRLFVAGFGMMQVMMYAVPVYMAGGAMSTDIEQLMRLASLVLTAPVVAWSAMPFYRGAVRSLRGRRLGMDVPIAVSIVAAFAASAAATLAQDGEVYFDSVTMFVFLLLAARYFELAARIKAVDAQTRIARLAPATAVRLDRFPAPQRQEEIAAAALAPGDLVLVRPGASVPADGVVVDGASALDESLLSGESRAVPKAPGEHVVCGALNKHEPLIVRVEQVGERSLLAGIVRMMDRAQTEKPRIARVVDRVAAVFVACVLVLAAACALGWYWVEPARALWITVAVLVASCPCALSLATPAAMTAATTALYRQGVLLTRGHVVETLAQATHFVFDKTGSLTSGDLTLVGVLPLGELSGEPCLRLAATLETRSEHPVGRALVAACSNSEEQGMSDWHHVVGQGIEACIAGVRHRIGRPAFVAQLHGLPPPQMLGLVSDEVSVVALGNEGGWLALLTFAETLRPDARRLVSALQARGAQVCLLSGDRSARVARLARELGIVVARAEATPEDKLAYVRRLQGEGAVVAMIGDGVNDAPVLAQAQVSFALASGADLAHGNADAVLMGSRLGGILTAIETAGRTMRIVRQNLLWAAVYNAIALPLAAAGVLTPLGAAVGMSLSSLLVVGNALRLLPGGRDGPGKGTDRPDPARENVRVRPDDARRSRDDGLATAEGRHQVHFARGRIGEEAMRTSGPAWRTAALAGE